jgi:hypothetical protein
LSNRGFGDTITCPLECNLAGQSKAKEAGAMRVRFWVAGHPRKTLAASVVGVCLVVGGVLAPMLASAATPTPRLKITPSSMYYPCSEGDATFSVKGFAPTSQVTLRVGSAQATPASVIDTNSSGAGSVVLSFEGYYPGYYTFYATGNGTGKTVHHLLNIGECP